MKIIAIETSHDDTSVVIYEDKKILHDFSFSQTDFHKQFGGTLPEYASRLHFDNLKKIAKELSKIDLSDVDHIAYTKEPGLVGSLHMGRLFAYAISMTLDKPIKAINHMHAHIFAVGFNHEIKYPAIALIVSGGHTQLWKVNSVNDIKLLGETKDDAIGEVFDKVARKLKIGFPGGPVIDKLSKKSLDPIDFSIDLTNDYNFSFSGLKTKVMNYINNTKNFKVEDVARGFQEAAIKNLIAKSKKAIKDFKPSSIILGGGVSANSLLRKEFQKLHPNALLPELKYTTDNASMIAMISHLKEKNSN